MSTGNWTAERSTTVGTGAISVTGALDGFVRFIDSVPAGPVWYSILDENGNREAGGG